MTILRKLRVEPDFGIDKTDKYKVKFCRMISGVPSVVSTRRIKKFSTVVHEHGLSFGIDFNKPTYRQKNTYYYMFDIENGQMLVGTAGQTISPALTNMIVKKSGIRQLIMGMEKRKLGDILIYILLAIACGVMGGYLLGTAFPMG